MLDLDVFHGVYSAAMASYSANFNAKDVYEQMPPEVISSIDNEINNMLENILRWAPSDASMCIERLRLIGYHASFLRRYSELLKATYTTLFPLLLSSGGPGGIESTIFAIKISISCCTV